MCQRIGWKNTSPYILHEMSVENLCQCSNVNFDPPNPKQMQVFSLLKLSEEEVKIQREKVGVYEGSLRKMFFDI
jgi:hypothetical protein